MELWIRSQNRQFLIKATKIESNTKVEIHSLMAKDEFDTLLKTSEKEMKEHIISQEG